MGKECKVPGAGEDTAKNVEGVDGMPQTQGRAEIWGRGDAGEALGLLKCQLDQGAGGGLSRSPWDSCGHPGIREGVSRAETHPQAREQAGALLASVHVETGTRARARRAEIRIRFTSPAGGGRTGRDGSSAEPPRSKQQPATAGTGSGSE